MVQMGHGVSCVDGYWEKTVLNGRKMTETVGISHSSPNFKSYKQTSGVKMWSFALNHPHESSNTKTSISWAISSSNPPSRIWISAFMEGLKIARSALEQAQLDKRSTRKRCTRQERRQRAKRARSFSWVLNQQVCAYPLSTMFMVKNQTPHAEEHVERKELFTSQDELILVGGEQHSNHLWECFQRN